MSDVSVHLVGSVPLEDSEHVFRALAAVGDGAVHRFPDGETGARKEWIIWQGGVFESSEAFVHAQDTKDYGQQQFFGLSEQARADGFTVPRLGYAAAAIASYGTFARLRDEGTIARDARFQVSLPTPTAVVAAFIAPDDRIVVEPVYEEALARELTELLGAIPAQSLAVQWDVAVEFAILEGVVFRGWWESPREAIVARLIELGDLVPEGVDLGYHLCYGDAGHAHFVQPADTALMVSIASEVAAGLSRRIDFLHLPVPRDRTDDTYFAPLADLHLPDTELFLGLVHVTDGAAGAARRITAARRAVPRFGIATECGLGRRDPETVGDVLDLHSTVIAQTVSA
jgi:hypothetical protein